MGKGALILMGIVALVGFWVWSQRGQVRKPAVGGNYIRVQTVLDKDAGKVRILIGPVGVASVPLSAFSLEANLGQDGGKPVINKELVTAGWSFPIVAVANQTLKLSGIYISPTTYMLSGEVEVVVVPVTNLSGIKVSLGKENTRFLNKDAAVIPFKYE